MAATACVIFPGREVEPLGPGRQVVTQAQRTKFSFNLRCNANHGHYNLQLAYNMYSTWYLSVGLYAIFTLNID
jgi:hypothetical protein